jgi:tetratricopeptide (TPR) repeat protein
MQTLEIIDNYFQQNLDETEKKIFESRCENDKAFAEEVAFYITSRGILKEQLLQQKQAQWKMAETNKSEDVFFIRSIKKIAGAKWAYAAAACLLLAFGTYFFERSSSPNSLADNYVQNNFNHLGLTMDGSKDSMQAAITAYNNKQFDKALPIFEGLYKNHPENNYALADAGKVYLVTGNYDKAIQKFDELANTKGLFSNPGMFLKAITLLHRNNAGDKTEAKQLLETVKDQNLEGSKDAAEWLKKF